MTGKPIDGREAHRIGFANRIAPVEELDAATDQLVNELLAGAPARWRSRSRSSTPPRSPGWPNRWSARWMPRSSWRARRTSPRARARHKRQPEFAGR